MKNSFLKRYRLGGVGLLIIIFSFVLDYAGKNYIPQYNRLRQTRLIQKEFLKKESIAKSYLAHFATHDLEFFQTHIADLLQIASTEHVFFYFFEDAELKLWTSNKVIPDDAYTTEKNEQLVSLGNGFYYEIIQKEGKNRILALIPIQNNYPVENKYLKNVLVLTNSKSNSCLCFKKENALSLPILNKSGKEIFKITFTDQPTTYNWLIFLYFTGAFLIFISLYRLASILLITRHRQSAFFLIGCTLVISVLGWQVFHFPAQIFLHKIFDPKLYAGSGIFSSLGDLFIFGLLLIWLVSFLYPAQVKKLNLSLYTRYLLLFLLTVFSLSISILLSFLIRSLVVDSSVVFSMHELFSMDFYSFLSFIILFMLLYVFIKLLHVGLLIVGKDKVNIIYLILLNLLVSLIVYSLLPQKPLEKISPLLFSPAILILLFIIIDRQAIKLRSLFSILLFCAGFVAVVIYNSNKEKEEQNMRLVASAIISTRDYEAEELFQKVIESIKADPYITNYFENPLISKSLLKKRIERLYFQGYFSKYRVDLQTYDLKGFPFKSNTLSSLDYYKNLIEKGEQLYSSKEITYISTFDGAPYYLFVIQGGDTTTNPGILIIELKQKTFFEQSVYPELIVRSNRAKTALMQSLSYAIYNDNILINQKGDYSYSLALIPDAFPKNSYYDFEENGYDHLVLKINDNVTIFVSKKLDEGYFNFSLFSLLFLLSSLISLLVYVLFYKPGLLRAGSIKNLLNLVLPPWPMSFKSKVQLTILISIFTALGVSAFLSLKYSRQFSENTVQKELTSEINSITDQLSTFFKSNHFVFNNEIQNELRYKIDVLASISKTDINLFDTDGNLVISSQMPIYERKIISRKMDAGAFYKLRLRQTSHLIQNEKIGGKIHFLSAYSLIRDDNNLIYYFVNIPYLAKEREIEQELTSLVNTLVNLFLFLFLILTLISITISDTFTRPLEIITQHLREVKIGKANTRIKWSGEDELGKMINEYNKMITEVEKSAEALAQTERESAWREMAKQVAHEIKNPLTPMKLSLQQLLRAWDDKSVDMNERLKKTVGVLMNRIDILDQIATEFSRFARLPLPNNREMIIEETLEEIIELFKNSRNIQLVNKIHTSNSHILGDESLLSRVFNNLLKNAIQSVPEGREGKIEIETSYKDNNIVVSIADNGSGIPEELHEKIFTPNFSTKSSGMGLGLAIVKRIIDNSKGEIWFKTNPATGTLFFISFPLINM